MINRLIRKKEVIVTGLDIGSSKIAAVAARTNGDGSFHIVAEASCPSRGVTGGVIVDLNEAVKGVSKVLARIGESLSIRNIDNIYANISGESINAEKSKGMIPLSIRGREITRADMAKCVHVASTIQLPFERDIIHRVAHNFSVDDGPNIVNPLGLYASRLACEMFVISADINHTQNIFKCASGAGYDIKEVIYSGIADGMSILSANEKLDGAAILNIGSSLTELTVFQNGAVSDLFVAPLGAAHFKEHISNPVSASDMLSRIKYHLDMSQKNGAKMAYLYLTGGFAFSDGAIEFLEENLGLPVKLGIARDIRGELPGIDSIRLTTAIGLARYAEDKHKKKTETAKNVFQYISNKVVDIFNNYF